MDRVSTPISGVESPLKSPATIVGGLATEFAGTVSGTGTLTGVRNVPLPLPKNTVKLAVGALLDPPSAAVAISMVPSRLRSVATRLRVDDELPGAGSTESSVNIPVPPPRYTATSQSVELAGHLRTAKSTFPSWLKSPSAIPSGVFTSAKVSGG